jgi:hypothetical protein
VRDMVGGQLGNVDARHFNSRARSALRPPPSYSDIHLVILNQTLDIDQTRLLHHHIFLASGDWISRRTGRTAKRPADHGHASCMVAGARAWSFPQKAIPGQRPASPSASLFQGIYNTCFRHRVESGGNSTKRLSPQLTRPYK